MQCEDVTRKSS